MSFRNRVDQIAEHHPDYSVGTLRAKKNLLTSLLRTEVKKFLPSALAGGAGISYFLVEDITSTGHSIVGGVIALGVGIGSAIYSGFKADNLQYGKKAKAELREAITAVQRDPQRSLIVE